jgi:hypothetical protein
MNEKYCLIGKIHCFRYRYENGHRCTCMPTIYQNFNGYEFETCPWPSKQQKIERYNMCSDQPAQIDCRNDICKWHSNGRCTNISPAITIYPYDGHVHGNCYSRMID